jgi:hypothetical protein
MRGVLVLIALLLSACEQTIVLGTECPPRSGPCDMKQPLPGEDDDGGSTGGMRDGGDEQTNEGGDAGVDGPGRRDAGAGDSGPARDASVVPMRDAGPAEDAGPALFPAFRNPSFELFDGGQVGALPPTTGTAGAPAESSIPPWYTCRPGTSVNSLVMYGLGENQTTVRPRDGDTFATDTIPLVVFNLNNGLTEELGEPLLPDQRYAFAVDLFAQPDLLQPAEYVLDLLAADVGCFFGRKLASSDRVVPGEWQTYCVRFISPPEALLQAPIRSVMFQLSAPGSPVNLSAAMHIDNIRFDPKCAYW